MNLKTIYFYGTCILDCLSPTTGLNIVRLFEKEKYKVIFPQQTCCGQPPFNSGYRQQALKVAKLQLDYFSNDYPVIFPSASCAAMMKHHYHSLFKNEEKKIRIKASNLSKRVQEWSQFYYHLNANLHDKGKPIRIVWQPSCHSLREMHIEEEPISLLKKLSNVEIINLEHQKECCGFGGTFSVKFPQISIAMADQKIDEIIAKKVEVLVSSDISCMNHLKLRMEKFSKKITCFHLADFIYNRITA